MQEGGGGGRKRGSRWSGLIKDSKARWKGFEVERSEIAQGGGELHDGSFLDGMEGESFMLNFWDLVWGLV